MKLIEEINFSDNVLLRFSAGEFLERNKKTKANLRKSKITLSIVSLIFLRIICCPVSPSCNPIMAWLILLAASLLMPWAICLLAKAYSPYKAERIIVDGYEDNEQFNTELLEYCSVTGYEGEGYKLFENAKKYHYEIIETRFLNASAYCIVAFSLIIVFLHSILIK